MQAHGLTGIPNVPVGEDHSLPENGDDTGNAWGGNTCGRLRDGTTADRSSPAQVPRLTGPSPASERGVQRPRPSQLTEQNPRLWPHSALARRAKRTRVNPDAIPPTFFGKPEPQTITQGKKLPPNSKGIMHTGRIDAPA